MATYDITTQTIDPSILKTGDIINCPYSGTYKSITLPEGIYKLEVWGAQGGLDSIYTSYNVGKGGYSYGNLTLQQSSTIYLYSGGKGKSSTGWSQSANTSFGGFNGGGYAGRTGSNTSGAQISGGGGGGSDIRIKSTSLYARVIAAGGGGGFGLWAGGNNGGQSYSGGGISGEYNSSLFNQATQTSGYAFGNGMNATSHVDLGGGGGGWYGGYTSTGTSDSGISSGGGGSGYVYTYLTYQNYPSGCLLDSSYYLDDAQTIAGNQLFLSPLGVSETGHSGDGYCRITILRIGKRIENIIIGNLGKPEEIKIDNLTFKSVWFGNYKIWGN